MYVRLPLAVTVDAPDLDSVRLLAVPTVVAALAQLVVAQLPPGVAGMLPPLASTDA